MKTFLTYSKTFRKIILLSSLFITCLLFGQTNTWDGSSSNNWNTAANWSLNLVPTTTHNVVININATIFMDVNTTINSLTIAGSSTVSFTSSGAARTITISNNGSSISSGSSLTLQGSTGTGTRSMGILFTGTARTISIAGSLTLTDIGGGTSYNATNSITTVTGTLKNTKGSGGPLGIITSTATNLIFGVGGTYQHDLDAGAIPTATWNTTSTCNITGIITAVPSVVSFAQSFGNFTWNCPAQTAGISLAGNLTVINGNFSIVNTNTGSLRLSNGNATATLEVGGDFSQTAGDFYIGGNTDPNTWIMNVHNNFSLTGGILYMSANSGSTTLNVSGDYTHSGGTLTESSTATNTIVFNKTGTQIYTSGGTLSNTINFTVNSGSTLQMGTGVSPAIISNGSSGTFKLLSGATLGITSTAGIATTGVTGNIQVTGTRTYAGGANYIYNGTSAQIAGNGLTQNTPANLTINNSVGTTLSAATTVNGNLLISQGTLSTSNYSMFIGGSWINNGGFTAGTGIVTLDGLSEQTIGGTSSTTFNRLILNNANGAILTTDQTINNLLTLTNGKFDLSNKILTMGPSAPAISGTFSSATMIIADGGGQIRKSATSNATASYTFPIGDGAGSVNGAEYSPISLNVTTGTGYSSASYIGVSLGDSKHSNNSSATNYLTRYWIVTQSGVTSCAAKVTGTFINSSSDVGGTLGNIKASQLSGTFNQQTNPWKKTGGSVLSGTSLIYTGASITAGQTSVFTGITSADPTVSITGGAISICPGTNVNLGISTTADPTIIYSWSPTTFLSSSTIANPVMTNPTSTKAYTVTIKDGNGISATSAPSTITVNSLPDNTTTSNNGFTSNGSFCQNDQATITFNANDGSGVLPYTLLYRNDYTSSTYSATIPTDSETAIDLTPTPSSSTPYTLLSITDANGCINSSPIDKTAQVTIRLSTTASLSGNAIICSGDSTNFSVALTGVQPWSLTYTDGTTPVTIIGTSTPQIISVSPSATTSYSITAVSDANCNGTFSGNATVTVNPNSPVSLTVAPSVNPACIGTDVTFTASPTNEGNAPVYQWKLNGTDVGTNSVIYTNSALANGDDVSCTITSNATCAPGSLTASQSITMTVNNLPAEPTIGDITQPVCPLITGSVVLNGLPSTGTWTINPGNIPGTGYSASVSGISAGTTSFTVTDAFGCTSLQSEPVIITNIVKRWVGSTHIDNVGNWFIGSNWTPVGTPEENTCVEIPNNGIKVKISGQVPALVNALTITGDGKLEVDSESTLIVQDFINVYPGGVFTLQDSANLIQVNNTPNLNKGNINVIRSTTPLALNDYTYWSSPTSGTQSLRDFSPNSNPKYFLTYDNTWSYVSASTTKFDSDHKGVGYAIIAPKGSVSPAVFTGTFTGVPNNGDVTMKITTDSPSPSYKLIGNPYPSALDADAFITANLGSLSGTLYLWPHNIQKDYSVYNLSGGVPSNPKLWIASGQGFVVQTVATTGNITFTNDMRTIGSDYTNGNFSKNVNIADTEFSLEKNRIWLNLTNGSSNFSQTLIGYMQTATNGYDSGFDGLYLSTSKTGIYSLLGNGNYTIQSKALPFSDSDIVPLGYITDIKGNTTISIDTADGLFANGQDIFVEDKLLNIVHNLKTGPYTFSTEAGTFNDRLTLRYSNTNLGLNDPSEISNNIIITSKNQQIKVQSTSEEIAKVLVYDLRGRTIYKNSEIDGQETLITDLKTQEVLIVKVVLRSGHSFTTKLVNR